MFAWHITAKDLYLLLRDRRTFAVLLLLPLVFIVIIGLTTGKLLGWKSSNQVLKVAAVDLIDYAAIGSEPFMAAGASDDDSQAPTLLSPAEVQQQQRVAGHIVVDVVNGIQKTPGLQVRTVPDWKRTLNLGSTAEGEEAARQLVADGDVNAALIFAPDFYQRVYHLGIDDLLRREENDEPTAESFRRFGIEIVTSSSGSSTESAVAAIVALNLQETIAPIVACRSMTWSVPQRASARYRNLCGPVNQMAETDPGKPLPPKAEQNSTVSDSVYNELVPSYTVMFVFFLVNIMARSFLAEREMGTLRRLRIAPIPGWTVLVGKTIPFLVISLIQTAVLFLAGKLLFGMSWGDRPWMLLPLIFATSCSATGLGLMIATLVKSDAQVSAYATTAVIILAGISGCFMPRQWLPELMQQISLATPHAWALIAYDQLLSTTVPNLQQVWKCVGMLLAFAAGFMIIGGLRFRTIE